MAENETVNQTGNVIVAVMYISILLAVMLLAVALVINGVSTANTNLNGKNIIDGSKLNETGSANTTGYTVMRASVYGFTSPAITALWNLTDGTAVNLANASISNAGVVKNASTVIWSNLSISYTYKYDVTNTTGLDLGLTGIRDNTLGMVANFFALMPTIGTILAVIVLIAGIVLLVLYVKRMKDSGSSSEQTFSG